MFSFAHRFIWSYTISAQYADGSIETLLLPLQSERTFFLKYFYDFKEIKFHLNIYGSPAQRMRYAFFLC